MPKRPKDKNAPKRPQSSYFLFSNQRRKELKVTNPDKKVTEISKIIASEWKKMDAAAKKPFEIQAKELKEKYQNESKKYKQTQNYTDFQETLKKWKKNVGNGETKKGKDKGKEKTQKSTPPKRPKDPQAPKKPQSAYFLFANERRAKLKEGNPDKKITEIAKMLGAEWKVMTAAQKKPWEDKAKTLKDAYETKFAEYKQSDAYKSFQDKMEEYKKDLKNSKKSQSKRTSESEQSSTGSESGQDSNSSGSESENESSSESEKKKKKKSNTKGSESD